MEKPMEKLGNTLDNPKREGGEIKRRKLVDITTDSQPLYTPQNERELAYNVIKTFAEHAEETNGWEKFKLYNKNYYDDTDGSGIGPNRPGVEAIIEVTAPSGKIYSAMRTIDEERHNERARVDYDEYDEDFDDVFCDRDAEIEAFWDYP